MICNQELVPPKTVVNKVKWSSIIYEKTATATFERFF